MPYLSQTFESYRKVEIYIYTVKLILVEEIFTAIWNLRAFCSLQIEHYALKIAFYYQCYNVLYFPTAYYSVYGVNSYTSLNKYDFWYLKIADLVIHLALKFMQGR